MIYYIVMNICHIYTDDLMLPHYILMRKYNIILYNIVTNASNNYTLVQARAPKKQENSSMIGSEKILDCYNIYKVL